MPRKTCDVVMFFVLVSKFNRNIEAATNCISCVRWLGSNDDQSVAIARKTLGLTYVEEVEEEEETKAKKVYDNQAVDPEPF